MNKLCRQCGEVKPKTEFSVQRTKGKKDGLKSACKPCHSKNVSAYQKANPEKWRGRHYLREYGICLETYNEMLAEQAGTCAICKCTPEVVGHNLKVDHCHISGQVRGLLCSNCNIGIGMFKDSQNLLEGAAKYITLSNEPYFLPADGEVV